MSREELKSPQRRTLTRRLIREAMLDLLQTQPLSKISVRELCDAAGVNRTTFYNHYHDTSEVLAEIEELFLAQLSTDGTPHAESVGLAHHIESLCTRLQKNRNVALILMENNADPHFFEKLLAIQDHGFFWQQLSNAYPADECALLRDFLSTGAYALVFRWLKNDCRQSPKQIGRLLSRTIQTGVLFK